LQTHLIRGLGELEQRNRFMGRRPKPEAKIQNQLEELSEENRRLREIVAYLSEAMLTRIVEATNPQSNRDIVEPQ
jgi:hypothetical protein